MSKKVKTEELFNCEIPYLCELFKSSLYPWEILPKIKGFIKKLLDSGIEGFVLLKEGVLVGENVKIYPNVTIESPAIIGSGTEIRPGAFIRGSFICGKNCVLGNSSEFKNCVLLDKVQVPHYNYVGDSILGNHAHLGAGAVCSNLKADGKNVVIKGEENFDTGLRKVGGFLGDFADVGCGCVLNPGTIVGKNTNVYPQVSLRGVYPESSIVKDTDNIVLKR